MRHNKKNKKFLIKLLISAILMFGFCYLMVPLYTLVCQQIGINGHVYQSSDTSPVLIDTSRTIRVDFSTGIHDNMHWQFKPLIHHITLHPGETKTVYFYAENDSGHEMTVQAIPSITPSDAAKYLKKTQCFCFTQQTLVKGEKADMPVVFHLDPELPNNIHDITLNYTLFDVGHFYKKNIPHHTPGRIEI